MFLDYFRNKDNELNETLRNKKRELSSIIVKIKENRRFLEMIEQSKTTPFTEFTPQVISANEKKKQEELLEREKVLLKRQGAIEDEIVVLEEEIKIISAASKEAKEAYLEQKNIMSQERKYIADKIKSVIEKNLQDPMRGNLELKELLSYIEERQ